MDSRTRNRFAALVAACTVALCGAAPASKSPAKLSATLKQTVETAYKLLHQTFYVPIDSRTLERGALDGIARYERAKHKRPGAQPLTGNDDASDIDRAIATASAKTGLSPTDLTYAALSGMAGAARDRWTVFLTPAELQAFNTPLNPPTIFGIGVIVGIDRKTSYPKALFVVPNGPADRGGLQTGDLITAIDGTSTKALAQKEVTARLRGPRGSTVRIAFGSAPASPREAALARDSVQAPTVFFSVLPGTTVGYVYIAAFGRPTADEFAQALTRLQRAGMTALVLDLRDDGGGYVQAAVSIVSHFFPTGPVVSSVTRDGNVITQASDDESPQVDVPTVVLVNAYTASASEITAGALQDTSSAKLVGTRTFGKGVEQTLSYLPDGSAIKITTARYLTPNNRNLNGVGLVPDRTCPMNARPQVAITLETDPQVRCALAQLKPLGPARS